MCVGGGAIYYTREQTEDCIETCGTNKGPITRPLLLTTLFTYVSYRLYFHEIIIKRLFFGNGVLEEFYSQHQRCLLSLKNKGSPVWSMARVCLHVRFMVPTIKRGVLPHVANVGFVLQNEIGILWFHNNSLYICEKNWSLFLQPLCWYRKKYNWKNDYYCVVGGICNILS